MTNNLFMTICGNVHKLVCRFFTVILSICRSTYDNSKYIIVSSREQLYMWYSGKVLGSRSKGPGHDHLITVGMTNNLSEICTNWFDFSLTTKVSTIRRFTYYVSKLVRTSSCDVVAKFLACKARSLSLANFISETLYFQLPNREMIEITLIISQKNNDHPTLYRSINRLTILVK